ncbi:MAG: hypothetical protein K2O00_03265 [Muribaculaceae bacterium]|nr:hypothetical protein [Muribaculaceae bacterium]
MLRKLLATAALMFAVMLTGCGSKEKEYSVDDVMNKIEACETLQQLVDFAADQDLNTYVESLPEDEQNKILKLVEKRAYELTLQVEDLDEVQNMLDEKIDELN